MSALELEFTAFISRRLGRIDGGAYQCSTFAPPRDICLTLTVTVTLNSNGNR